MKVCETQNSPFNWILAAFECLWICHFDSPQGGRRSEEPIDVILTNDSEKEMNQSNSDQIYFLIFALKLLIKKLFEFQIPEKLSSIWSTHWFTFVNYGR